MPSHVMDPLRAEHRDLVPHIQQLRTVADAVGTVRDLAAETLLDEILFFLRNHLLHHARAEEAVLYPAVAAAMGAPEATLTMSRDHVEVERLVEELASLRERVDSGPIPKNTAKDLRRVLYGLYSVVKLHFAKEEEIYLPVLERELSQEAADALFAAMQRAARELSAA